MARKTKNNDTTSHRFARLFAEIQTNDEIGVIVFTGAGRAFSAGGDIEYFERDWNTRRFRAENHRLTQFFDELELIEKPVIAAINGPCTGAGLQITLSCDLRIASDQAKFGFRENNIGLIPGAGGCSRLVKLIGYGKAKELIFTGEMIPAVEAERITGVQVASEDGLAEAARRLVSMGARAALVKGGHLDLGGAAVDVLGPPPPDGQGPVGHRALLGAPVHEDRTGDAPPGAPVPGS